MLELRVRKLAFLQLSTGGGGVNVGDRWGERRSLDQGRKGDWRMGGGQGRNPYFFHTMNFLFVLGNSR